MSILSKDKEEAAMKYTAPEANITLIAYSDVISTSTYIDDTGEFIAGWLSQE